MRRTTMVFSGLVMVVLAGSALADDQDNLDKALETGQDVYCNSIRDSDLRNYCQGVVKGQDTYCNNIRDSRLKQDCKDRTKMLRDLQK